jgi:hypothetical protein
MAGICRRAHTVGTMNTRSMPIPRDVVQALRAVDHELREDVIDPETMTLFVQAFGYDDACAWLSSHPLLYFEALRRCRESA